jgi:hypothetical protein
MGKRHFCGFPDIEQHGRIDATKNFLQLFDCESLYVLLLGSILSVWLNAAERLVIGF